MDGLDDGADASGGASGLTEDPLGLQLREGAFSRCSEPGVVAVELLVVLGVFAVVLVRGANSGAGALVGAVLEDEGLPGQAGLDDAVGPGRGQIVSAARCCTGEPQRCAVGPGNDLDVHAMPAVFHRVVRLVRGDAVDGDQGTVDDDVVAFTEAGERFVETGRPVGQDVQRLVDVPPGGGLRYPKPGSELRERLVLPQMDQREQCLLEAVEPAPAGIASSATLLDHPGNMLNKLARNIEHGRIRNQQGPFGRQRVERDHHAKDEGPCLVTTPADQPLSPSSTG